MELLLGNHVRRQTAIVIVDTDRANMLYMSDGGCHCYSSYKAPADGAMHIKAAACRAGSG